MSARLKDLYDSEIKKQLYMELSCKNINEVPKLEKIVLNMGVGEATGDKKKLEGAINDLTLISGQKVSTTKAKKSVATFKLREGMNIGCKVTLRKERMYEFLDRLINISLPRVRDFRGLSIKSFDGRGNYALGIKEQIVFPEISYDDVDAIRGLDIIICTSAKNNEASLALLKKFNFPFRNIVKEDVVKESSELKEELVKKETSEETVLNPEFKKEEIVQDELYEEKEEINKETISKEE
tara:strand:+ start:4948 stop:5664 length:717 start_codon:yes stop_codon:yes gene_type:complete